MACVLEATHQSLGEKDGATQLHAEISVERISAKLFKPCSPLFGSWIGTMNCSINTPMLLYCIRDERINTRFSGDICNIKEYIKSKVRLQTFCQRLQGLRRNIREYHSCSRCQGMTGGRRANAAGSSGY